MTKKHEFNNVGKRLGDIKDYPPELISQLKLSKPDELEQQIITVFDGIYNGMASLDEVLIGIYRRFQSIYTRQYLLGKLYGMLKSGLIFSVKSKKGVYCTRKELENYYIPQKTDG